MCGSSATYLASLGAGASRPLGSLRELCGQGGGPKCTMYISGGGGPSPLKRGVISRLHHVNLEREAGDPQPRALLALRTFRLSPFASFAFFYLSPGQPATSHQAHVVLQLLRWPLGAAAGASDLTIFVQQCVFAIFYREELL